MIPPGLNQIYLSLRKRLAQTVSRIVPPREVEDIVQETYVRLCQVDDPSTILHPRSYLLKTARNLALDHMKRAESRLIDALDDHENQLYSGNDPYLDETYTSVVTNQEFGVFCEAVRHLPTQCRKAFVLKKVYGYSQREIGEELNLSESTVEKQIALGVKCCSQFMARYYRSEGSESRKARARS